MARGAAGPSPGVRLSRLHDRVEELGEEIRAAADLEGLALRAEAVEELHEAANLLRQAQARLRRALGRL